MTPSSTPATPSRPAPVWQGALLAAASGGLAVLLVLAFRGWLERPWSIVVGVGVAIGVVTAADRAWRGPRDRLLRDALSRAVGASVGTYVVLLLLA